MMSATTNTIAAASTTTPRLVEGRAAVDAARDQGIGEIARQGCLVDEVGPALAQQRRAIGVRGLGGRQRAQEDRAHADSGDSRGGHEYLNALAPAGRQDASQSRTDNLRIGAVVHRGSHRRGQSAARQRIGLRVGHRGTPVGGVSEHGLQPCSGVRGAQRAVPGDPRKDGPVFGGETSRAARAVPGAPAGRWLCRSCCCPSFSRAGAAPEPGRSRLGRRPAWSGRSRRWRRRRCPPRRPPRTPTPRRSSPRRPRPQAPRRPAGRRDVRGRPRGEPGRRSGAPRCWLPTSREPWSRRG